MTVSQHVIRMPEYAYFVDRALTGMQNIVAELGDELANTRPALPDANTCYATLNHCLKVTEYWIGHILLGRDSNRDRAAEFNSHGSVADILSLVSNKKNQLKQDIASINHSQEISSMELSHFMDFKGTISPDFILMHVYRELAQHLGHMEVYRDILLIKENSK